MIKDYFIHKYKDSNLLYKNLIKNYLLYKNELKYNHILGTKIQK